jgi:hypothetical protein
MTAESSAGGMNLENLTVDENSLFREENYTDGKIMSLRKLIPVKSDGSDDENRECQFIGQTQVMSQMGPLPINVELEAKTLADAVKEFPDAAKESIQKMIEEVREMQREQAGRIVVPQGGQGGQGGMPGMGGAPGGGAGGGGKIQF